MKQLLKTLTFASLSLLLGSCDVEYDPIVINPNVALQSAGMTNVPTISIYQNDVYAVTLSRTEGLSRAAEFDVIVNQEVLDAYNELNGSSFKMMPESGYTIGVSEVVFPEKSKTATFNIQFKPQAILQSAGSVAAAEQYVIPVVCLPRTTVNSREQNLNSIIRFNFAEPTVTVDAPVDVQELTFIAGVPVTRKLELKGSANFTTMQVSKLAFAATQEMVDSYNTANNTFYKLLPSSSYSIDGGAFDQEELTFLHNITLDASALDPDFTYLLPLKVLSDGYTIKQDNIYYVRVLVQEIQVALDNTERYEAATKLSHKIDIDVRLNGALSEDVPVEFSYDPSLIEAYNQAKGTNYQGIDAAKIAIVNAPLVAGKVKTTAKISVDMAGMGFEGGVDYLLPFVLDKSKLPQGYMMQSQDIVYVRVKRTLYGSWSNRNAGGDLQKSATPGWSSCNYMKALTTKSDTNIDGRAYPYVNTYFSWATGYHWNVKWDQVYNNEPNKRVVKIFSKVTTGYSESQQEAQTMDLGSYFDLETGMVYFNFQYYWNDEDKAADKRQSIKCYLESPLTVDEF